MDHQKFATLALRQLLLNDYAIFGLCVGPEDPDVQKVATLAIEQTTQLLSVTEPELQRELAAAAGRAVPIYEHPGYDKIWPEHFKAELIVDPLVRQIWTDICEQLHRTVELDGEEYEDAAVIHRSCLKMVAKSALARKED